MGRLDDTYNVDLRMGMKTSGIKNEESVSDPFNIFVKLLRDIHDFIGCEHVQLFHDLDNHCIHEG